METDRKVPGLKPEHFRLASRKLKINSLKDECKRTKVDFHVLERNVATYWNSTVVMLDSTFKLRSPVDNLCDCEPGLAKYKLTKFKWEVVMQLQPMLVVIPLIGALHNSLVNVAADTSKYQAIHHAAQRGIAALNKYYSLTDESYLLQFVLLLHPTFKVEYMQDQEWEQDWIDQAVTLLCKTWQTRYAPTPSTATPSASAASMPAADLYNFNRYRKQKRSAAVSTAGNQLETYLSEPVLNIEDPLAYRHEKQLSGACPELMQMVLDYLTIPATSVDVEQAFSFGCQTVSLYCHSLSKNTIRTSIVFSNQCKEGLVKDEELVTLLQNKASQAERRSKGGSSGGQGNGDEGDEGDDGDEMDLDAEWTVID
ncbi:hypothetical protein BOTBODRAFT_181234 [Botryobasidium botryosum FD-172 SS1]|uniref:HAT C-terminal dimerisation domain-containing protein n=1 Tax=Botryobasidium botryosum (strain FD-172 SS1) TaxID=930990 RepID=A0A067LU82_BOTB1|nr:hypothetical protein BOTBODRAFT_181234 [Botryobasidium botryosum FD-172 SS1]